MKILVTGCCGQLGNDVIEELAKGDNEIIGTDIALKNNNLLIYNNYRFIPLDITKKEEVESVFKKETPDFVIHCAGWTAVDLAEDEDKKELVWNINVNGTKYLAEQCKAYDSTMLFVSTDYVFSGIGETPLDPDSQDFSPLNYYGLTKYEGELAVKRLLSKYFIVRISWLFGKNGNNFVETIIGAAKKYNELRVVNDQIGNPTYTRDLAVLFNEMLHSSKYGCYNASNDGDYISWYDFAVAICKNTNLPTKIIPVSTIEYGISKAKRPFNSRFDKNKLAQSGFNRLPNWEDALKRYLAETDRIF